MFFVLNEKKLYIFLFASSHFSFAVSFEIADQIMTFSAKNKNSCVIRNEKNK